MSRTLRDNLLIYWLIKILISRTRIVEETRKMCNVNRFCLFILTAFLFPRLVSRMVDPEVDLIAN